MAQLEIDVILLWSNTTALANLQGHRARDDITGRQVLCSRGISFHEAFTLGIKQISSFTTRAYNQLFSTMKQLETTEAKHTLSNQATSTINPRWMELYKLQI